MINDTNKNKKHIVIVTGNSGSAEGAVRYDEAQVLTDEQKAQAVENLGLATVASTGDYDDLQNKPTIPAAQVQSDWSQSDNTAVDYIKNKPTINTEWFGTQAQYDAILVKDPDTIYHIEGGAPVQSNWNEADNTSLAYIQNKPTIPAAPVQSNWNEADNTSLAYIQNKPTIPTVPAMSTETLTFTLQGGTTQTITFFVTPTGYFYIEDASGSDNTLSITKNDADAPTIEVFKSTDQLNWESMGSTSTTPITATVPANGKLYLKATVNGWGGGQYNSISCSGNYNVGGNSMSLLYGDSFTNKVVFPTDDGRQFWSLFKNDSHLINAEDLILPANTLKNESYREMFCNCTGLTTAPVLPATILSSYCYQTMFKGCTSLTTAPALPATTAEWAGYSEMFYGCTSLTTAPVLPATTLSFAFYERMFYGCTSLNSVTTYANDISSEICLDGWLQNVAASGDFYNLGGATYESGASGIPTGWTEHTSL